jgi:hypothetical protein
MTGDQSLKIADWLIAHGVTNEADVEELIDLFKQIYVSMFANVLENTAKTLREKLAAR